MSFEDWQKENAVTVAEPESSDAGFSAWQTENAKTPEERAVEQRDIESRQAETLRSYPGLYDAPTFTPEPDIGVAVEQYANSGIPENELIGMAAAAAGSQPLQFDEALKQQVTQRKYQGFWDELSRAYGRFKLEAGSALLTAWSKMGEAGQAMPSPYSAASKAAGVDYEVEKAAAQSLWDEAQGFEYQPGSGGGLPGFVAQVAGNVVPYVGLTLAIGAVTGPVGAFGTSLLIEGGQGYREALADGRSEEEATANGLLRGSAVGLLETLQLGKLLKFGRGAKAVVQKEFAKEVSQSAAQKLAKSAVVIGRQQMSTALHEGFIEVLQEWAGDGTAFLVYGKTPEDLARRTALAGAGGFVGALLLGPAFIVLNGQTPKVPTETDGAPAYEGEEKRPPVQSMDEYAEKVRVGLDPLPPMVMSEAEYAQYEQIEAERSEQEAAGTGEAPAAPVATRPETPEPVAPAVAEEVTPTGKESLQVQKQPWEMTREELSQATFYHASHGELQGSPQTGRKGFYVAVSPQAAQTGGKAGGTLPDLGVSLGTPQTVTPFKVASDAKVFGRDSVLIGEVLPASVTADEYATLLRNIEGKTFSPNAKVNEVARRLANLVLEHAYVESEGNILRKTDVPTEQRGNRFVPIDLLNDARYAPDWEGFEFDGIMPDALRALGYDAAFVRDEGGLSITALTDKALTNIGPTEQPHAQGAGVATTPGLSSPEAAPAQPERGRDYIADAHWRWEQKAKADADKANEWAREVAKKQGTDVGPLADPNPLPKMLGIKQALDYLNVAWPNIVEFAQTKKGLRTIVEQAAKDGQWDIRRGEFDVQYKEYGTGDIKKRPIGYDKYPRESVDEWAASLSRGMEKASKQPPADAIDLGSAITIRGVRKGDVTATTNTGRVVKRFKNAVDLEQPDGSVVRVFPSDMKDLEDAIQSAAAAPAEIVPPAAPGIYRFRKLSKAIEGKDFDALKEMLIPDPDADMQDLGVEYARRQFEDETGIELPPSQAGTENTIGEFVLGRLSPVRQPRLGGGAQAGGTTILPDVASEVASIVKTVTNNPIRLVTAVWESLKRNMVAATTYMRTLGPAGKHTANEIDDITYNVTKLSNTDIADLREIHKGVPKHQRELLYQAMNERVPLDRLPQWLQERVVVARKVLDRAMNTAAGLGMMRKLASGEVKPVSGVGKAYPQIPNAAGLRFLEEAYTQGQGSSRVFAWAQDQVQDGKFDSVDKAIRALVAFRDSRFRGINAYLERSRVELPVEMVEWDGTKTLPTVVERNWMTVEGVRKWGVDFEKLAGRIEKIREDHGADAAQRVKTFIQTAFGLQSPASRSSQTVSNIIRGFQFTTKIGLSPLTIARNMTDRLAKGMMASPMATIQASIDYPPFLNALIPQAQRIEDRMIRNGVVFGHSTLSEGYEAGNFFADLAKSPFASSERGNQVFIAHVHYLKLMHDVSILQKANSETMGRVENAVRTVFGQSPAQAAERVGPEIAAKVSAGEEITQNDIYRFLHEMVRDRAFPMILSTKPIWYDSHPMMKVLAQFKTWPMRQTNMIWQDVVKYTIRTGDLTRLIGFITGTLIAGELYNVLRDLLYGRKESVALSEDPAKSVLKDLADGGLWGIVADLTYGIQDWAGGVSLKTAKNVLASAHNIYLAPGLAPEAIDQLATQEVTLYRQGKELARRLDKGDMAEAYTQWRAKAWEWRDEKKAPSAFAKTRNYAEDIIFGKPEYEISGNTLALDLASRHVVAGDIEGASRYIRFILDHAEDPKAALSGIKASRTRRSPLGPIKDEDQREFLLSLDGESRRAAEGAQREYLRSYDDAIRMARRR